MSKLYLKKILLAMLIITMFGGCSKDKKERPLSIKGIQAAEGIPVKTQKIEPSTLIISKRYSSSLRGKEEAQAKSFIGGNIDKIRVKIGDYVKKDQIIATFGEDEASSSYRQAKAAYNNSRENYESYKKLFESGAISKQAFDGVETKYNVDKANFEAAERQVFVKSPISGYVTEIYFSEGDNVESGKPIAKVSDITNLSLKINIPENDIIYVSKDTKVVILTSSIEGKTFGGKVDRIAMTANEKTHTFEVEIAIDDPGKMLRSGIIVEAELNLIEKPNTIYLPTEYLLKKDNKTSVYAIENGTAKLKEIQTGISTLTITEIASGLTAGDEVVTVGSSLLSDGLKVKIVN